jgi:rubredoxin
MAEKKFEEGHCPECGAQRADVVAQHKEAFDYEHIYGATYYSVLECRGCGHHYFKSLSWNSEDIDQEHNAVTGEWDTIAHEKVIFWPPAAKRRKPEWADEIGLEDRVLGSLFGDVYTALSNNLGVLAAIGMRTVFDRASELLEIDPGKPFKQKLDDLKNGDHVTEREVVVLTALIDAGSAAAHRGWQPKPKQLDAMMTILEAFLHRAFLLEEIGAELGKGVPQRKAKGGGAKKAD